MVDEDRISRSELFDEADLDTALARFEELSRPVRRLENAASRVCARFRSAFAARDWGALADMVADDLYNDDRRPVVNAGIRHGRDSSLEDLRAAANMGVPHFTGIEIATRGERLVLVRGGAPYDKRPEAFQTDVLQIAEIDADGRIAALVMFDPDDVDAAFEELDARYLFGEAAVFSDTWSVIAGVYAGFNRHELPATTPQWIYRDHRSLIAGKARDLAAYIRSARELTPDLRIVVEAVHRLNNLGAVVTHTAYGTTGTGFGAEWRMIDIYTRNGNMISRCEMFDEAELEIALARFDELSGSSESAG